jgi:glucosamine 6-phosphate synthetase-like amidotransferase/phosphosugar isomerase protein
MCGIAGYSLSSNSNVDRTLAAQALLAGIADRGADAVGYAYRAPGETYSTVVKQRTPASELLARLEVPEHAGQALIHVRDYTKGHPSISANNHPVRHGPVVGIHNGIIVNDDEILEGCECARAEPRMSVDSEAILALAAHSGADARAFDELRGAMATAWFDERSPDVLYLARGAHRPLWVGLGRRAFFFASTKHALQVLERYAHLRLRKREVPDGTLVAVQDGEIVRRERFRPDHEFVEAEQLPAVRAPGQREACLSTLAALLAA